MPVPKRRNSKSKKRSRKANWSIKVVTTVKCSNCGYLTKAHAACINCGFYKGKQVIKIKEKLASKD